MVRIYGVRFSREWWRKKERLKLGGEKCIQYIDMGW
jgi:hypothetical protein